jgi:hypothetical protein
MAWVICVKFLAFFHDFFPVFGSQAAVISCRQESKKIVNIPLKCPNEPFTIQHER